MALRTFRSNPSLGGFGSKGSDGDAFCQIIKELVDNAVDACSPSANDAKTGDSKKTCFLQKRVRVVIEDFVDQKAAKEDNLLRVTVSDNGLGMNDIQACVDPFSTSKAHQSESSSIERATSGRYGIGLTLCLLHAQRLVPGSCTLIKSATRNQTHWTEVTCVVDTDRVVCIRRDVLPKVASDDSGTSISILVPGGSTAERVWPRLAEYFARFRLSLGLPCSLEVLAPTLSAMPLLVRSLSETTNTTGVQEQPPVKLRSKGTGHNNSNNQELNHHTICNALQHYLGRTVNPKNVAHAIIPIRFRGDDDCEGMTATTRRRGGGGRRPLQPSRTTTPQQGLRPKIEVYMAVLNSEDDDGIEHHDTTNWSRDNDDTTGSNRQVMAIGNSKETQESGSMILIRMVNRIPLLDSAEGIACGFVQGLASKKSMWNSFGLNVSLGQKDKDDNMKLPQYEIRDNDQVAPFFQQGAHDMYVDSDTDESDNSEANICHHRQGHNANSDVARKRRRHGRRLKRQLLPAKVRLAHMFCVVQIHAKPTELPLPTLSKGRLPLDNEAIDQALETGLTQCLRQLQKSNPNLLLTPSELRVMERDYRYVPLVASAVASIIGNFSDPKAQANVMSTICNWGEVDVEPQDLLLDSREEEDHHCKTNSLKVRGHDLAVLIESRLAATVSEASNKTKNSISKRSGKSEEYSSGGQSDSQCIRSYKDLLRGGDSSLVGSKSGHNIEVLQQQYQSIYDLRLSPEGDFD